MLSSRITAICAFSGIGLGAGTLMFYSSRTSGNRIFNRVRYEQELEPIILATRTPLLANFHMITDARSRRFTDELHAIVKDTDKRIALVDIESDEPEMREIKFRYGVNKVPTVVALRKGLVQSLFTLPDDSEGTPDDWTRLKEWVDQNADEPESS